MSLSWWISCGARHIKCRGLSCCYMYIKFHISVYKYHTDAIETFFYHICKMDTKTKQLLILYNYKIHLQTQINIRIEVMNTLINYRHQIFYFFPLNYFRANFLSLLRLWCIKPYLWTNIKPITKTWSYRTTNPYVFMSFARSMAHWECHNLNDVYLFTVFSGTLLKQDQNCNSLSASKSSVFGICYSYM